MQEQETQRIRREFSARLNEALDDKHAPPKYKGRQTYVAKLFGVTQKGARRWLEASSLPRAGTQSKIAKKLGVRVEWLMFNLGPKRAELSNDNEMNAELMQRIIMAVDRALKESTATPDEKVKAQLVTDLYRLLRRS